MSSRRFTRETRLLDAGSFQRVFEKSNRSRDTLFTVLSRANGRKAGRLGLAISKKNCRLAVQRNRLKRVVRESFRQHKEALGGLDVVVMSRSTASRASNRMLFDSLAGHWQKCRTGNTRPAGAQ
ncbi:MAG: ribonuclease P protein component [Proteobacteria bacterium]|nr:ribonuclease P protein component [Pseudomonadota bacterium]